MYQHEFGTLHIVLGKGHMKVWYVLFARLALVPRCIMNEARSCLAFMAGDDWVFLAVDRLLPRTAARILTPLEVRHRSQRTPHELLVVVSEHRRCCQAMHVAVIKFCVAAVIRAPDLNSVSLAVYLKRFKRHTEM